MVKLNIQLLTTAFFALAIIAMNCWPHAYFDVLSQPLPIQCLKPQSAAVDNKSQPTCPVAPDQAAKILFSNDIHSNHQNLIAGVIFKSRVPRHSIGSGINVNADLVVVGRNKKSHAIVHRASTNPRDIYKTKIMTSENVQLTWKLPLLQIPLDPDCYYEAELIEIRAYNKHNQFYHQLDLDEVQMRRLLPVIYLRSMPFKEGDTRRHFGAAYFGVLLVAILIAAVYLKKNGLRFNQYSCTLLLFIVASLIYTAPFDLSHYGLSFALRTALLSFAIQTSSDVFLVASSVSWFPLESLIATISFFYNLFMAAQFYQSTTQQQGLFFPRYKGINYHFYENNLHTSSWMIRDKKKLYYIALVIMLLRCRSFTKLDIQLAPLLACFAFFALNTERTLNGFLSDDKNPFRLCLLQGLLAPALVVFSVLASNRSSKQAVSN